MYLGVGLSAKKSPPQSVFALRRADYQLAVPLKLRIAAPLMRLVFQACCSDAASRKTISSGFAAALSPLFFARRKIALDAGPGFTASARKGWACWEASAAGFQLPRLSGCGAFPAVFVIAFGMELKAVYHQNTVLSSQGIEKQRKNRRKKHAP